MIVQKFGSTDVIEIEDPPPGYSECIYCYAAKVTCRFYQEGDTIFIRVEGDLRAVRCMGKSRWAISIECKSVTEEEAQTLIKENPPYN